MCRQTPTPDHDTLAPFRRRFLKEVEALSVQVLLAREMKRPELGHIALDGTKIDANASKHKALSWAHANKIESQLRQEVQTLLALAEKSDRAAIPDGMDVPAEIARREDRLSAIAQAKAKRKTQSDAGQQPHDKESQPPAAGPKDGDQVNWTNDASRIMPTSGGGFEQSYNAQAGVDIDAMMVITAHVSPACNDKREVVPTLEQIAGLPDVLGEVQTLITDNGFFSQANAQACVQAGGQPLQANKRESHHEPLSIHVLRPA